jgi:hypothetical protein
LNAAPAAAEYARIVGCAVSELSAEIFGERTLMVKIGGEFYVRSIQKAGTDGSLTFYSAIEQGVVLTVASPGDLIADLRDMFAALQEELGPPQLVIGFDCVLRGLEMERRQVRHLAGRIMAENNVVGFATYGEQYHAMHLNQTFTGVAIGRAAAQ